MILQAIAVVESVQVETIISTELIPVKEVSPVFHRHAVHALLLETAGQLL
tara:strand:+ start:1019 stop:1168 length:150 start_codon:yes stop_codon:yes gene_type:complete